jgi:hypothetical protein
MPRRRQTDDISGSRITVAARRLAATTITAYSSFHIV